MENNGIIGIVVAMPEEAEPVIRNLNLKKSGVSGVYQGFNKNGEFILLVISSIGKVNAQNATWILVTMGAERIVNVGTAGDVGDHGVGNVVFPNIFFDGDYDMSVMDDTSKDPALINAKYVASAKSRFPVNPVRCYSYSTFVCDSRVKGGVVDMEAYGIASVCEKLSLPFICIKCLSDKADSEAEESFNTNIGSVIEKNIKVIEETVNNFNECYEKIYKREV